MTTGDSELRLVQVTCPDMDTAQKIGHALVQRKLAACVNILPGIVSVYRWKGEVNEDAEVLMMVKTREEFVESIFTAVVANHPYTQPTIEVLPIVAAGRGVAQWIEAETGGEDTVALP